MNILRLSTFLLLTTKHEKCWVINNNAKLIINYLNNFHKTISPSHFVRRPQDIIFADMIWMAIQWD